MPSLRDSGKIVGSLVSIRQLARECNLQFPLSLRQFIDAPCPFIFTFCNRIHIKVLTNPRISISTMLDDMRQVYATAGIRVQVVSRETLTGPDFTDLNDVEVGACQEGSTTPEQNRLFGNRNNVGDNELVVYFVNTTVPANNGCAIHPDGRPGAVVASIASPWTLAHEVGHVLGLNHISGEDCQTPNFTRLMTGCGTSGITGTPIIVLSEIMTMRRSNLSRHC